MAGAGKGIFGFFDAIYGFKCGKLPIRKCASSSYFLLCFLVRKAGLIRTEIDEAALESRTSSLHIPCCDSSQPATAPPSVTTLRVPEFCLCAAAGWCGSDWPHAWTKWRPCHRPAPKESRHVST